MDKRRKSDPQNHILPLSTKIIYGSGEFGFASIGMMRSVFYAFYLTDVVGLDPRLASFGALVGLIWDSINDPLVGILSDRVRSRWGRRRPFLLIFAVPFALSFVLLWSAPAWDSEVALLIYVTLSFMLVDTLSTLISIPYLSLTPELTPDYDERTALSGYRSIFQLVAGLAVVVAAPMIVDAAIEHGLSQQRGFMLAGALFGALGMIPYLLIFFTVRETATAEQTKTLPIGQTLRIAWSNIPFRFGAAIHLLNWVAVDMVAVVFPFYLLYWIARGDLLAKVSFLGIDLALETAFFGLLMLVCIATLPFWMWFSRRRNKREAYVVGLVFWIIVELLIFVVQPDQMDFLLVLGGLAGFGVAAAYVLPDALFADIIEWDELRTHRRQEGVYYGARALIRKLAGALVIFVTLQLLGWSGYQSPPADVLQFTQPDSAMKTIRILVSPAGAGLLLICAIIAWLFPLSREKHSRIRTLLARRKERPGSVGE
jgi:GPH family glycoside/pentoside/hexuronide:cation symporter